MEVRPGDVLGKKYRVEQVLGRGGMGVVVGATHLDLEQRVAVKLMLPSAFADADLRTRFQREARAAGRLRSEHVARVLDTGTFEDDVPYIVMEFLEGNDLAAELTRAGVLSVEQVSEYVLQACDAIAEAHSLGIVHRDLKPANIFLTRRHDGTPLVKVLDFGISKASVLDNAALAMTATASMMGSPLYMSPEQMRSSRDVDARSDVWSLGVILYELLSGHPPFAAEALGALMAQVMIEPHRPLASVRPDVPAALSALVDRCLVKDRAQRASSVAEIGRALGPYVPPRAFPLVERIVSVLGARNESAPVRLSAASTIPLGLATPPVAYASTPAQGQSFGPPAPAAPTAIAAIAGTSPAWSGTAHSRTTSRNAVVLLSFVISVAVTGLIGGGLVWKTYRAPAASSALGSSALAPSSLTPATSVIAPAAAPVVVAAVPSASAEVAPSPVVATAEAEPAPPSSKLPVKPATRAPAPSAKPAPLAAPSVVAAPTVASPTAAAGTPRGAPSATVKKPGILDTSQ